MHKHINPDYAKNLKTGHGMPTPEYKYAIEIMARPQKTLVNIQHGIGSIKPSLTRVLGYNGKHEIHSMLFSQFMCSVTNQR